MRARHSYACRADQHRNYSKIDYTDAMTVYILYVYLSIYIRQHIANRHTEYILRHVYVQPGVHSICWCTRLYIYPTSRIHRRVYVQQGVFINIWIISKAYLHVYVAYQQGVYIHVYDDDGSMRLPFKNTSFGADEMCRSDVNFSTHRWRHFYKSTSKLVVSWTTRQCSCAGVWWRRRRWCSWRRCTDDTPHTSRENFFSTQFDTNVMMHPIMHIIRASACLQSAQASDDV